LVFEVDRTEVSGVLVLASNDPGKVADRARVTLDEALAKLKPSLQKSFTCSRSLLQTKQSWSSG
jgi:hypothetical protein